MNMLFLILISLSTYAGEIEDCRNFVNDVLKPAVTTVEDTEDHGNRFIKDEAEALKILNQYEISKLGQELNVKNAKLQMTDCKYLKKENELQFCEESLFANLDFHRGLIYGMKHYGWKQSTIDLGTRKVFEYIKLSTRPGPLLEVAIGTTLLNLLVTELPQKNIDANKVKKLHLEVENAMSAFQKKVKENKSPECANIQAGMKEEFKASLKYGDALAKILGK